MLLTTYASRRRFQAGGVGGLAYANFVTAIYEVGGSPVTASDIVDQPGRISASGLLIDENEADGAVNILGGLLDALKTLNWTMVLEVEMLDADFRARLLGMRNTEETEIFNLERRDSFNSLSMLLQDIAISFRECNDTTGYGTGIHRMAITHTPTLLAISVNGNAPVSDTSSLSISIDAAAFGDYPGETFATDTFYVRSLQLVDPVAAASLPGLSG